MARHPLLTLTSLSTADLRRLGYRRGAIRRAVEASALIRVRRGKYVAAETADAAIAAARLGGRLDCVSLLREIGVFVADATPLHINIDCGSSRLPVRSSKVVAHWRPLWGRRDRITADLVEAIAQACRCQRPREAIATLDSAWNHGVIDDDDIDAIFAMLPRRHLRLRNLLDRRSESGPETLVRLMLRTLTRSISVQHRIAGIGRVDFLVDGWLIVECDSHAHHADWAAQKNDRRRDQKATALGYATIRLLAEDILYRPDEVIVTLREVLTSPMLRTARGEASRAA